jgi:hypothetical protein
MGERVSVEPKQRFSSLSLKPVALGLNISHFHINSSIMETKRGDAAVTIERNISWVRWHKWIHHHTIKSSIDLYGNVTVDYHISDLPFETAWEIGS